MQLIFSAGGYLPLGALKSLSRVVKKKVATQNKCKINDLRPNHQNRNFLKFISQHILFQRSSKLRLSFYVLYSKS